MSNVEDPRVVAGLRAQQRLREQTIAGGATRFGWKAGLGTEAAMHKAGLADPLTGFLTDQTHLPDGATVAIADWPNASFEAEVAVRIGRDVEPGASPDRAAAAIESIAPAIELVDLGAADDIATVLAGNVFHRAVIVGKWVGATEHPAAGARLTIDDGGREVATRVDPAALLGDLAAVVAALAGQLPLAGDRMLAGDVVMTGSAIAALALTGGERLRVTLEGAGSVGVQIV